MNEALAWRLRLFRPLSVERLGIVNGAIDRVERGGGEDSKVNQGKKRWS